METHQYKENKLSPGNCIACGLIEDCEYHAKAPVNTPVGIGARAPKALEKCNREGCHTDMDHTHPYPETPTDESWEKEFDKQFPEFGYPKGSRNDRMRAFIASLLQKESEKARTEGYEIRTNLDFEAGKSEAFSLVRKMIMDLKSHDPFDAWANVYYDKTLKIFLSQLSTLEGK